MAFVSDLHIGPTTPRPLLETAFSLIRDSEPDLLLIGGDHVHFDVRSEALELLSRLVLSIRCPVKLAVLGNHDLWTDDEKIAACLGAAGVQVLVNQSLQLPVPWQTVTVVGLDDPSTGVCDAAKAFRSVPEEGARIVLCHSPDGLLHLESRRFDLFLCGHTHGGQIATPWGPIVLPKGELCRRFHSGFHRHAGGLVGVSRGIGGVGLPVRLFSPPDLFLLDCRSAERSFSRE